MSSKSLYEIFQTDPKLEKDGIELAYGPAVFVIARAGGANEKFKRCMERKLRPYRSQINMNTMDDDVANRLLAEAYAESVILGWEGVTDREGITIEFTQEACVQLMVELPDLFSDLQTESQRVSNYNMEIRKVDAKT